MHFQIASLILIGLEGVRATNDWTKPCFDGVCEYSLPESASGTSGSLKIWGPPSSIADITPSAGWDILDCTPDALDQEIRLVCTGDADACARLYSETDSDSEATNKIVRLPENCGAPAFARIARAWIPADQTLPQRLAKRQELPPVRALALDTAFGDIPETGGEPVRFVLQGANVPGADADLSDVNANVRRSRIHGNQVLQRGLGGFIKKAVDTIKKALNDANTIDASQSLEIPVDVDEKFNVLNQTIGCGVGEEGGAGIAGGVTLDVSTKAHALAKIGVTAIGTFFPPNIEEFAIVADLDATLEGAIDLKANVLGTLESGDIPLFSVGIPGLDFPGILTIGPTFEINANAVASLDVLLDLSVGVVYNIEKAQFVFPPQEEEDGGEKGSFTVGDTPLTLSVSPSVKATGTLEAHIIPSLNLGISALGDIVEAKVFLELDANAKLILELEAGADVEVVVGDGEASESAYASVEASAYASVEASASASVEEHVSTSVVLEEYIPSYTSVEEAYTQVAETAAAYKVEETSAAAAYTSVEEAAPAYTSVEEPASAYTSVEEAAPAYTSVEEAAPAHTSIVAEPEHKEESNFFDDVAKFFGFKRSLELSPRQDVKTETNTTFGGCFRITTGLDVSVGAEGSLFAIFDESVAQNLFSVEFELFEKCFGDRVEGQDGEQAPADIPKDLTCAAPDLAAPAVVAEENVAADAILAIIPSRK